MTSSYRPLDPAIDPNDERSKYIWGGSGQISRVKQQDDGPDARANGNARRGLDRGVWGQEIRAATLGTTVRLSPTSARPPQAKELVKNT